MPTFHCLSENVHRIPGEIGAAAAANAYEADLRREFLDLKAGLPVFDLVMLGLGDDGHTASLFPGEIALDETERWAVAVDHSLPPPPLVPRVTVTLPVINAARRVLFLVAGGQKSEILYRVLMAAETPRLPAQRVQPESAAVGVAGGPAGCFQTYFPITFGRPSGRTMGVPYSGWGTTFTGTL